MKTIWKYPLVPTETTIDMPEGAEILCVDTQFGTPCLWAVVYPKRSTTPRRILVVGTGHEITETLKRYIGTFQLNDGSLVFHVFEV